jgi:hypothetical protein
MCYRSCPRARAARSQKSQVEAAAEAADIPERSMIIAANALGVRTQRGQWWLPG